MFSPVDPKPDFPAMERARLAWWKEHDSFKKLVAKNRGGPRWSFIDGPITANNPMGVHHAWGRTYKDLYQRYYAMRGFDQRYQNGYDGQGLWIEVEVEKELGFKSKREIEAFGVDRFVELCKERVRHFSDVMTQQSIRLGYWMDWENSYHTMSDQNNYTIWFFLKRAHEKGLLYKGHDVMPWCPRCSTGMSNMEILTEGYQELTHLSIFLKLPIVGQSGHNLLVWTTTPWTLTSNVAAAVHPDLTYVRVRQGDEVLYLSKGALANAIRGPHEVETELPGRDLEGWRYRGPFDELGPQRGVEHRVILWDEVSDSEGTGIVHIAPGCGKEDFGLSKDHGLAVIAPIDEFGRFLPEFEWLSGQSTDAVVADIVEDLDQKGVLYRTEDYVHRYPVCWRCSSELVFRLVDEWFIAMDPVRNEMMAVTRRITWIPEFGLDRELDWLRNMDDWMISKKRYYGLALPIYECKCGHFEVIGSRAELDERAVEGWDQFEGHSPHRPWIDAVKIGCPKCGAIVSRIADVGNTWLDAGIVPYSTLPFRESREEWEKWFPADFITESFPGQFRNWFYSMLAQSTVLEGREPFKVCFGYALLRDDHGEEMHKSKGNSIPFDEAAEKAGADVLRWMFARCNPFQNLNFGYKAADDVRRRLLTLWNVYSFFVTYARIDGWTPAAPAGRRSALDRWILARQNGVVRTVRTALDQYDAMTAARDVEAFVDELSTWYLRRGRRRYWKSEADADKAAAYATLHHVLVTLSRLLAPFQPFLAEELYQNLVRGNDATASESVHHTEYPDVDPALDDEELVESMDQLLRVVNLGRAARNRAALKVRQPLARVLVSGAASLGDLESHLLDELNVRAIDYAERSAVLQDDLALDVAKLGPILGGDLPRAQRALVEADRAALAAVVRSGEALELPGLPPIDPQHVFLRPKDLPGLVAQAEDELAVAIDTRLTPELVGEGHAREIVHHVQSMRKKADYRIEEKIATFYEAEDEIARVFADHDQYIRAETLSSELRSGIPSRVDYAEPLKLDGHVVRLAVSRS